MPLNLAMSIMSVTELLLWGTLGFLFWSKKLQNRFPMMSAYLALRVVSMPVQLGFLYLQSQPWGRGYFPAYFYSIWLVYFASAVLLFFVCIEIFRVALSAFSGLIRFGTVIFRWAAIASLIVSLSSISWAHKGLNLLPEVAVRLMRSVSVLELCLLAFLCLSMNALHLSLRDRAFGFSLGFGILCTNDFVVSSLVSMRVSFTAPLQFLNESLVLVTLALWMTYVALPEAARKPVVVAANSTIYRWNEIASALGHKGTNIAVPATANSFFLTDVEKVVDKVLTRNLRESETNS